VHPEPAQYHGTGAADALTAAGLRAGQGRFMARMSTKVIIRVTEVRQPGVAGGACQGDGYPSVVRHHDVHPFGRRIG
jgi:hypothetical protein